MQNVDELVLIPPVWPRQSWHLLVLQMCTDLQLLLGMLTNLFSGGQLTAPTNQGQVTQLENFERVEISEESSEILLAVWRNSTSVDASGWNKRVSWCTQRKTNHISISLNMILEFLKNQFKEGKAHRPITIYRSALSTGLPEINSNKLGAFITTMKILTIDTSSTEVFPQVGCFSSSSLHQIFG